MVLLITFLTIIIVTLLAETIYWFVLIRKEKKGKLLFRSQSDGGLDDVADVQEQLINVRSYLKTIYFVLFLSGCLFLLPWTVLFYMKQDSTFLIVSLSCFVAILLVAYLIAILSKGFKVKD